MIGSGKSTLAHALGRELAAPVVSSDMVRKALAGLAPTERGGPELYTDASRASVYAELLRRADAVLGSGRSVVLDATYGQASRRRELRDFARGHGVVLVLVEVTCDEAFLRERLARRRAGGSVSDATDVQLDELATRHEIPDPLEGIPVARVDGGVPPARVVAEALAALSLHGIAPASERRAC
jgi:hypothetical protein